MNPEDQNILDIFKKFGKTKSFNKRHWLKQDEI